MAGPLGDTLDELWKLCKARRDSAAGAERERLAVVARELELARGEAFELEEVADWLERNVSRETTRRILRPVFGKLFG